MRGKAGLAQHLPVNMLWIPAFAGMTFLEEALRIDNSEFEIQNYLYVSLIL
jgi:hypothetical protein